MSFFDQIKKSKDAPKANKNQEDGAVTTPVAEQEMPEQMGENNEVEIVDATPIVFETPKPADDSTTPQHFFVGIDLGTTHCVLSYAEANDDEDAVFSQQVMAIPQLTSLGMVEDKYQLPSFLYQAHEAEISEGSTALPWTNKADYLVGEVARNLGCKKLVMSYGY